MTKEQAIKFLQQIYPNGGHCWLDEQRIEAIGMAIDALKGELVSEGCEESADRYGESIESNYPNDMFNRGDISKAFEAGVEWNKSHKKPVSEDFEKIVEEIAEPTVLNAYGTKELARRLRNTICGTSVSEGLEIAAHRCYRPNETFMDGFKKGAKWQKQNKDMKDKNYERAQLLCNLLQTICEAANGVEEMETDAGTTRILSFRYEPTIEFYEDDVRIIKELAEEMGEEFPYIIEEK